MSLERMMMLGVAAAALPGAAQACELQPPDWVPPSLEEQADTTFRYSANIVYGIVMEDTRDGKVPFKVLHVYKGPLKAGARLTLRSESSGCLPHLGFDRRGKYGVIAFDDDNPVARFIEPDKLEMMFEKGLLKRASSKAPAAD